MKAWYSKAYRETGHDCLLLSPSYYTLFCVSTDTLEQVTGNSQIGWTRKSPPLYGLGNSLPWLLETGFS